MEFLKKFNELFVTKDISKEAEDFLAKVKAAHSDEYSRFYTYVKNKGLEYAMDKYKLIDQDYIKSTAKKAKSDVIKANTEQAKNELKSLIPSKKEIANIIESRFLNDDFRKLSQKFNIPQLVSSTMNVKTNVSKSHADIYITLENSKSYEKEFAGLMDYMLKMGNTDTNDLLDEISKKKKDHTLRQKNIRKYKKDYYDVIEHENEYEHEYMKVISKLKLHIELHKYTMNGSSWFRVNCYAYYSADLSMDHDDYLLFQESSNKEIREQGRVFNAAPGVEINKNDVDSCIIDTLIKLNHLVINSEIGSRN